MLTALLQQKLTHFFNILDVGSDGAIDKEDFMSVGKNLALLRCNDEGSREYNETMKRCLSRWRDFCAFTHITEDDYLLLNEWLRIMDREYGSIPQKHFVDQLVFGLFKEFDIYGDEYIYLDEFVDFYMAYKIEMKYAGKSFTSLDLNHDQRISFHELQQATSEYFESEDIRSKGNWLFGFWGKELLTPYPKVMMASLSAINSFVGDPQKH